MNFNQIENAGKSLLEKFPVVKKTCKRIYQLSMYALANEKIKSEGDIKRASPDDQYEYFYGYYDKSPWDSDNQYMLCMRAHNTYKNVAPKQSCEIILLDTKKNYKPIRIAETKSWNVQQGCMAQWLGPDFKSKIIYNDFRDGAFCSVIFNISTMSEEYVYKLPVYDVSKDGSYALSLDFTRLHRLRPGYGYSNIPDKTKNDLCPDSTCIWMLDLNTGEIFELIKYTDLLNFESCDSMMHAEHKVNHIMIRPDGKRFMVLHRWFDKGKKHTRLLTMDLKGENIFNLNDCTFASHCYWKNNDQILGFVRKAEEGDHYYLMNDLSHSYTLLWPELSTDGHCSYSPDGQFIITDTYPNRKRLASVFLCTENGSKYGKSQKITRVFSPFKYDNDTRCDLHPRWDRNGDQICIDSVHDGKRGLYVIPLNNKKKIRTNKIPTKPNITVLMATYDGEKYLHEQVNSVISQNDVNVKLLIRDDGSTDQTLNILSELKVQDKITWYTGKHLNVQKGFYDLMKKAAESTDEYFAFCDQDDVWDDDKLSTAIQALANFPNEIPAIYYCGQRLVDKNLNFIADHKLNNKRSMTTRFMISDIAGCTMVFNKALLTKILEFEPNYMMMHDSWLFKVCLAVGGNVYADESSHISYRQHDNNVAGIGTGFKGKLSQIHKYIFGFKIQKQIGELLRGYEDQMVDEYKVLSNQIYSYNTSIHAMLGLLRRQDINFHNKGLNLTYKLKIFLRKL